MYSDDQLRPISRPVCTGPRQEDGSPSWPFPVTRAWTLFQDDIKVVKHGIEAAFGDGAEVHHALNSAGQMSHVSAQVVLKGLQMQGSSEVALRREFPADGNKRRECLISMQIERVY